uniref:Uncharacterized protein n=1 Tax=Arundo donax TaxID=35708 RepID=A0A0A9DQJ0_ARUDO
MSCKIALSLGCDTQDRICTPCLSYLYLGR